MVEAVLWCQFQRARGYSYPDDHKTFLPPKNLVAEQISAKMFTEKIA